MMARIFYQTDLELVDRYIETCLEFINPQTFNEIRNRGLYMIINFLPKDKEQAKAVARARMTAAGEYFGDAEIDQIAGKIQRLNFLRKRLNENNMADPHKTLPILEELKELSKFVLNYYKK